MNEPFLLVDGRVAHPLRLTHDALLRMVAQHQIADVSKVDEKRRGRAVRLAALLDLASVAKEVTHLGLHGSRDNFHASIPLEPVRHRGMVIYWMDGEPLASESGGPFRFFIPDHAACHTADIDECANVKFLDRIELTIGQGFDNRPQDDAEHARLHEDQT